MLLECVLAVHAALGIGGGVQPGGRDVGAALGAFAIGARINARQGGLYGGQVDGFAFVQGKLHFAFGRELGARILGLGKVVSGGLGPSDDTPPLLSQLRKQRRLLCEQLLAKGGSL